MREIQWILILLVGLSMSCDRKKEIPSLVAVSGTEERALEYRKSFLFDQKVSGIIHDLNIWNRKLKIFIEQQTSSPQSLQVRNSLILVLQALQESQRGFFKKNLEGWKKELTFRLNAKTEHVMPFEKIEIQMSESRSAALLSPFDWCIRVQGRDREEKLQELLKVSGGGTPVKVVLEGITDQGRQWSCELKWAPTGPLETVTCSNLLSMQIEQREVWLASLNYSRDGGFTGEGVSLTSWGEQQKQILRSKPNRDSLGLRD